MSVEMHDYLAARVRIETDGCWTWRGALNRPYGYPLGRSPGAGKTVLIHRWSYEQHVGPIPAGLTLDHLCRRPACVNPAHLEPVPSGVNTRRSPLTLASINAAKTHCPQGHAYTPENTLRAGRGRGCRQCSREQQRRRYAARQAKSA